MTIRESTANQILDISRLGVKNRYGEKLWPEQQVSINPNWEETVVYPGYFNSIGLKRLYFKDREINTKDKYSTPYRSYILEVCGHENTFVTQCVDYDRIYLKIVGSRKTIEDIEASIKPDFKLEDGMTDKEIIESNRRDLSNHKRIKTVEAKFNNSPEELDKNGQVITNIDHYDNFFYNISTCEDIIYQLYNAEKNRRWLLNKLNYLEERYQRFLETHDSSLAINALASLTEYEEHLIFRKSGAHIAKHMDSICFETGLMTSEVWAAWKYVELQEMEDTIHEIKKELERLDKKEDLFFKQNTEE